MDKLDYFLLLFLLTACSSASKPESISFLNYESQHDSYCHSSAVKVQSFLAGLPIQPLAVALRTEILTEEVQKVVEAAKINIRSLEELAPIDRKGIDQQDIYDYQKSGEHFRLIQSWKMQFPSENLSPEVEDHLREYLSILDLRLLEQAGKLARERRLSEITEVIIADASTKVLSK